MGFLDNVLLGPLRILLLFIGVLLVHQIVTRQSIKTYNLSYIIRRSMIIGSMIIVLIFVLVQLKMYDIFTLVLLLFGSLIFLYLELGSFKNPLKKLRKKRKKFLLAFFKFMEEEPNFSEQLKKIKKFLLPSKINGTLVIAFSVALSCLISRYLFLKNDLYTLSSLWIQNLEHVKSFNQNIWFSPGFPLLGEHAIINLYAKITGISEEMAVHSFGLLETFGVSLILYWLLVKISHSKFLAPIMAVLFFGFFYKYLPININLLLEHNAIYMAIWIALPAMVFTVLPQLLTLNKRKYFTVLFAAYSALTLISLFVALIIMPIFLVLSLLFFTKKTLPYILRSIGSYLLATVLVLAIHAAACWMLDTSFLTFLKQSMLLVDVYTYFPQLLMSVDELVILYASIGGVTFLGLIPLFINNKEKWTPAMVFVVFSIAVIALKWTHLSWIDIDLYYQMLSVIIIIILGVFCGVINNFFSIPIFQTPKLKAVGIASVFILWIGISYFTNSFTNYNFEEIDELKTDILLMYDDLSTNYLPYSYAVVNQNYGQSISKSEHHFINYDLFTTNYTKRDSVYQTIKEDPELLKKNSNFILPNSVFVFIAKNNPNSTDENFKIKEKTIVQIESQIQILKNRGRKVNVYFEDQFLKVYEIVNKENASKLNDLIFEL